MNINAELIRSERLKRAWSQEQLAHVSGLGLRTIQRIETAGGGSLETVKALAAVLELSIESLLVEVSVPAPVPFWRRPLNLVATASAAVLVLFTSTMLVPTVAARQVDMNVAVQRNGGTIAQPRLITQDGQAAMVVIDNLLKVSLTPRITDKDKGLVMMEASIYTMRDGEYELLSKPSMLMEKDKASQLRITGGDGQELNLSLTLQIK